MVPEKSSCTTCVRAALGYIEAQNQALSYTLINQPNKVILFVKNYITQYYQVVKI